MKVAIARVLTPRGVDHGGQVQRYIGLRTLRGRKSNLILVGYFCGFSRSRIVVNWQGLSAEQGYDSVLTRWTSW